MTAPFASFGNLSIDDLVFVDGTTQWAVPGGNAVYAALGMAVWGERPSVVAPFGPDYPIAKLEDRLDLSHCPQIPLTLRDWGLYEEDGSRQFIFRSATRNWDDFSPRAMDVRVGIGAAHLAPLPWERHVDLVGALRAAGTTLLSIDLDDRKLAGVSLDAVARLMASVDLFLPSRQDGRAIFPDLSPADTVRRLRDLSPDTPLIALKCGADGCVAHATGSRDLIELPAFPIAAVDATGAGDTFCGGTLIGYARTRDPVQALLHGAVSASFCVESVGCTGLLEGTPAMAEGRLLQFRNDVAHLAA
ncbi:carbohydrate kinase family protein [Lichenifustis flavocetrariae]|uniref:PfkB family carbohydrate kinase n=1 Tax=Lichenifustis flavocetrariae TaxID=2949735 RepID=A0AA42CKJ0_9HYPH|nr:PfkB family carbohydrate kinase [Lichenifustis flavocetrariae]MCW6510609.1 PfkB family carbohydrate kinase [Lichenifustis flavocetrariae]